MINTTDLKKLENMLCCQWKKNWILSVYYVKYSGFHKARIVADGQLTDILVEGIYYGVVSLWVIILYLFITKLNELETWDTVSGNGYLEAKTLDKVYIISVNMIGNR